jgi:nanoRNase/pAp phosphatase (c-di-AMP/oligoRNAs hydrolase)
LLATRTRKSDRLLRVLSRQEQIAVSTHDNPDPDAIASGWGLVVLLDQKLGKRARLLGRGAIVRAENRQMLRLLEPPIELVEELPSGDVALVLVDCVPGGKRHLGADVPIRPVAVIDHHPTRGRSFRTLFRDIRPRLAATATIVASYLREQGVEPDPDLATAFAYAIRTEACGHQPPLTRTDRAVLSWLSARADHEKLSAIANAPLRRGYFGDLLLALENTFVYDDCAVCWLPRAEGAETVGELADLLIRCEQIRRALAAAHLEDAIVLSARSAPGAGDAAEVLQSAVEGLGHGGGHEHRAGGKVWLADREGGVDASFAEIKRRWLQACGASSERGTRLVARRDILEHL